MSEPSKAKEQLAEQRGQDEVFGLAAYLINHGIEDEARVRARLRRTRFDAYVIEHVVALLEKAKAIRQGRCVFH